MFRLSITGKLLAVADRIAPGIADGIADGIAGITSLITSLIASPKQRRRLGANDAAGIRYALDTLYVVDAPIDTLRIDCSPVAR